MTLPDELPDDDPQVPAVVVLAPSAPSESSGYPRLP